MVTDLDLFGVQPQVRVGALQRPLAEQLDLLVQRPAERRDPILGHPVDPQLLNEAVDLPGRDAVHVRLQHDRDDRLLRAPARLQEAREVRAARAFLRDQQLDLPDPGLPRPRPIPVSMRQPGLRRDLAKPSTNLGADLGFHQLAGDDRDRLPDEILKPPVADLRDDIGNRRHALTFGHRGVSIHVDCGNSRRVRRHGGRPSRAPTYQALVTPLLPTRPSDADVRAKRQRDRGAGSGVEQSSRALVTASVETCLCCRTGIFAPPAKSRNARNPSQS